MAEEKTLGLKGEEEKTSSGIGQPENNAPSSPEPSPEEIEQEIEKIIEEEGEGKAPEEKVRADFYGEEVVLSKAEWEKLLRDKENYKKGLLSLKEKIKSLKREKVSQAGEALTREEYLKSIEKEAIAKACENPDINENWDKIMEYYVPRHGKETVSGILKDIERAYKLFRLENPVPKEKEEVSLGAEAKKPTGTSEPLKEEKRGGVLPRSEPITEWYKRKK